MKKILSFFFVLGVYLLLTPNKSFAQDSFTASNISYNSNSQQLTFTATNTYDNGANWDSEQSTNGFSGDNVAVDDTSGNQYGQAFFTYPNNCSFINGTMTCTVTLDSNSLTATNPSSDTELTVVLWDQHNQSYSQTFTYGSALSTATPTPTPTPSSNTPPFTATDISYNPNNQQLTFTASDMYDNGTNWNDEQGINGFNGDNFAVYDTSGNKYGQTFFTYPNNCGFTNGTMTCSMPLGSDSLTATSPTGNTPLDIILWDQHYQSVSQTFTYQSILPTPTPTPTPSVTSLTPTQDSFIQHNEQNSNEGSSPFLELSVEGKERALIQFNESQIQTAIGSDPNYTATLQLTIVSNNNKWSTGRQIDVNRMEQGWTEGNGSYNYNGNRGTGSGVTWDCATDTNITNQSDNCSGSTAWDMIDQGSWPFDGTPTATTTITNNQSGTVSFNVTSDVQSFLNGTNPNYGWIVKKDDETVDGDIQFGSRERQATLSQSPKFE